ncbi:uncharacterized protein V3H82_014850 [Fundulus diaphanus]
MIEPETHRAPPAEDKPEKPQQKEYLLFLFVVVLCGTRVVKNNNKCSSSNGCFSRLNVNLIKYVFTPSTTVPTVKQKGRIPIQEEKTTEFPKLKTKFTKIPKEKEPEKETITLKKVPVKPPEPEKQVVTHKVEVTKHHVAELSVHGLHDREDREVISLGRTERVFTAEQETIQLTQLEETETLKIVQTSEKEGWTRATKPKKEEEPEVPGVDKKKIKRLPKTDEQNESVKLKPVERSRKSEQEQIKPKLVPSEPKVPEKEISTKKPHEREDREKIPLGRPERGSLPADQPSKPVQTEEPKQPEEEDKSKWNRTAKPQKEAEPEPELSKKKIKKLPKKDEEQEVVTLKPFEKPKKQEAGDPALAKHEVQAKRDAERSPSKRGEMMLKDPPTMAPKNREDTDVSLTSPDKTPDTSKPQPETPQQKKVDQTPKVEEPTAADKPKVKPRPEKKEEPAVLKPLTKVSKPEKAAAEEMTKPEDTEKHVKKEAPAVPAKKPSPPGLKEKIPPNEAEKFPTKPPEVLKKGVELKRTPSPRVSTEKPEDKTATRPVEELKKVELKKTEPSAEKVKQIPKPVSPKDSIEGVTLKKVPRKPSAEEAPEPEKPDKGRIPLLKEISPGAVQMKRVTTQPEEEVSAKEPEEDEVRRANSSR